MELAQNYLAKYKALTPPQATKTKAIAQVISDECGIVIPHEHISIRRGGATLTCHPTIRSELLRHASRIMDVLHREHNVRVSFIR